MKSPFYILLNYETNKVYHIWIVCRKVSITITNEVSRRVDINLYKYLLKYSKPCFIIRMNYVKIIEKYDDEKNCELCKEIENQYAYIDNIINNICRTIYKRQKCRLSLTRFMHPSKDTILTGFIETQPDYKQHIIFSYDFYEHKFIECKKYMVKHLYHFSKLINTIAWNKYLNEIYRIVLYMIV